MIRERLDFRENYYPDGPYENSWCVWCGLLLEHTGAHSGVTWSPVQTMYPWLEYRDLSTCFGHEVRPPEPAYGGHEPWEAKPLEGVPVLRR